MGLIVTEPSQSGFHDLQRIAATLKHFRVPSAICINKADIYPEGVREIKKYALENGLKVLAEIPFDELVPQSMLAGAPITALYPESKSATVIRDLWKTVYQSDFGEENLHGRP